MGLFGGLRRLFGRPVVVAPPPDDLFILDNGIQFADGRDEMEALWYHLLEREAGVERELWRVVRLQLLRYLPQEARQEAGLTNRMRLALVGLYNQRVARYDLVELKAAIWSPPLGVLQMYGVVGLASTREEAERSARLGMAALTGVMSNFPQARFGPLNVELADWLRKALTEFPHALVAIGHPQERSAPRGMGREGPGERIGAQDPDVSTEQQGEMICRAMATNQQEFVQMVLASRLAQSALTSLLAGVAREAGGVAGLQTGGDVVSTGIALPVGLNESAARNAGAAFGRTEGESVSDGMAASESESVVESEAETTGHAVTDGVADTVGTAHSSGGSSSHSVTVSSGQGHTEGRASTRGRAHTQGSAHSHSSFSSQSVGGGWGTTVSTPATMVSGPQPGNPPRSVSLQRAGASVSSGESWDVNDPGALAAATAPPAAGGAPGLQTGMQRADAANAIAAGQLSGSVNLGAPSESHGGGWNAQASVGLPGTLGGGGGVNENSGVSQPMAPGVQISAHRTGSAGHSSPAGSPAPGDMPGLADAALEGDFSGIPDGMGVGYSQAAGGTVTQPANDAVSHSVSGSWGASSGASSSVTRSEAVTQSEAETQSQADSQTSGRSVTSASSSFHSTTHSQSHTVSHAETRSWARTTGTARGRSTGTVRSHGTARSAGRAVGRSLGFARGSGFAAGAVPSFAISRSYQWWNDQAVQLTRLLRGQEELLRQAVMEGGWQTDCYILCRTEEGAATAEAAGRQAYHGSGPLVVTPWQTRRLSAVEREYIRLHAMTFTPSTREERVAEALEAYKDSTLLLPSQLAAYVTPVAFEEGLSITTQERIPAFAFAPDMPGEVVLAHQWSTERAALTKAQLKLSRKRHIHTLFSADTRFGKTVAAERLALETTLKWGFRTIVLDFGMGWRRMLNAPLPRHRVQIYQLQPNAPVPLQFNPWQVPERVPAGRLMTANCELLRNAGRMGPKQYGFMHDAAFQMYVDHGVLTASEEVQSSRTWGAVRDAAEEEAINQARQKRGLNATTLTGTPLARLEVFERQALAVHRSRAEGVSMRAWLGRLEAKLEELEKERKYSAMDSLEGALQRLRVFGRGELANTYGPQSGQGVVVEDLGLIGPSAQPGIVIIEGGAELDDFAKVALLGFISWRIYNDAIVRRRESIGGDAGPPLQIFFEEANKILTGIEDDESKGPSTATSEEYVKMWRDGAKYFCLFHPVAQSIGVMPPAIISSCANAFFGQMKNPKDRDLAMAHQALSEKGFTDEDYKRFLSRMPQAMAVVKLGLSQDVKHVALFLVRPVMVAGLEPTDAEILAHHRAMEAREWRPLANHSPAAGGGAWVGATATGGTMTRGAAWA